MTSNANNNNTTTTIPAPVVAFFDSHGALWFSCDGNHPDAVAFGPTGTAREAAPLMAELHELLAAEGLTFWAWAKAHDCIKYAEDEFGFDTLI